MSWQPLASSNPVPGDPDMVAARARQLDSMADMLAEQAEQLAEYIEGTGSWSGPAQRAFEKVGKKVPPKLKDAGRRYRIASDALADYWPVLRDAQQEAEQLRVKAQGIQDRIDDLGPRADRQRSEEATAANDPTKPRTDHTDYAAQLSHQHDELRRLRSDLGDIKDRVRRSGDHAAERVRSAAKILHDDGGVWGGMKKAWHNTRKGARWLVDHTPLKTIAAVVEALAVALALIALVVSGVGLIALVVAGIALALGAILVVAGDKSFKSWALDAVLLALGIGVFKGAKGAKALAKGARADAAAATKTSEALASKGARLDQQAAAAAKYQQTNLTRDFKAFRKLFPKTRPVGEQQPRYMNKAEFETNFAEVQSKQRALLAQTKANLAKLRDAEGLAAAAAQTARDYKWLDHLLTGIGTGKYVHDAAGG